MWNKGRKGVGEDCLGGDHTAWRYSWGDEDCYSEQQERSLGSCPEAAHFFPSFILMGSFHPSSLQPKEATLQQVPAPQADAVPHSAARASITQHTAMSRYLNLHKFH